MIYVGMDVSFKSFDVYAVNERKKKVFEGSIKPTRQGLRELVEALGKEPKLIAFEAGNQLKWIALTLKKLPGVHLHVVHPNEVKWITESRGKTDKIDAKKLAELARGDLLPRKVHIVEGDARELRELVSARYQLQNKRVALINTLRGFAAQEGIKLPVKFFQSKDWQLKLMKVRGCSTNFKNIVGSYMQAIDAIKQAEVELVEKLNAIKDERLELLKTIPAIGDLSSRVLLSAIDDPHRFDSKKCVANYGALTPTIYQSGHVRRLGKINRDGRHEVRRVLLQCAHTIARMKTHAARPLKDFYERIAKKRGKKIAVVALARKLLTTAYGVMKSGQAYDPARLTAQFV